MVVVMMNSPDKIHNITQIQGYFQPSRFGGVGSEANNKVQSRGVAKLHNLLRILSRPSTTDIKSVYMTGNVCKTPFCAIFGIVNPWICIVACASVAPLTANTLLGSPKRTVLLTRDYTPPVATSTSGVNESTGGRAVPPQSGDPIASPGGASPKRHAQIYALHPTVTSNAPVIKEISIPVAKAISSTEIVIELLDFKRYSRPSNPFLPGSNIPKNKNSDNTANVDDNILKSGDSRPQLRAGVAKGSGSVDNRSTLKSEQSGPRVVMKARSIRVRDQALRKGEYNLTVDVLHDSSDADRRAAGRAEKPTTQSREVAESSRKKKGRRKGSRTRATKENSVKKTSSSSDEDSSSSEAPLYLPMASTQDDTFPSTKLDRNRVLQCLNKIFKTLPDTSPKTMTVLPKAPRQRKK